MAEESLPTCVVEASPLISFLKVDRFDLLESLKLHLVCTAHVQAELSVFHQKNGLESLLKANRICSVDIDHPEDLAEFARLTEKTPLGPGEASSIMYAHRFSADLVITDKKGIREAKSRKIRCISTQDVVVHAIQSRVITLEDADKLIISWKAVNEFPVEVKSFSDLVTGP